MLEQHWERKNFLISIINKRITKVKSPQSWAAWSQSSFLIQNVNFQFNFCSQTLTHNAKNFHPSTFSKLHIWAFQHQILNSSLDPEFIFLFFWSWVGVRMSCSNWVCVWGRGWDVLSQCLGTHSPNLPKIPNFSPHSQTSTRSSCTWDWSPRDSNFFF